LRKKYLTLTTRILEVLRKDAEPVFKFLSSVNTILGPVCYPGFLLVGPKRSSNGKQEDFSLIEGNFFPITGENLGNTLLIFVESFTSGKVFLKEREKNMLSVCRVPAPHIWGKIP